MSLIQVKNFSFRYDGAVAPALKNISIEVESGELVVLAGRSASGKTTLAHALAGFLFQSDSPDYSGEIIVNGKDLTRLPLFEASERVAVVQQNPENQFCTLRVSDEIAFGLENLCLEPSQIEEKIKQVLAIVQGAHLQDREIASLSGGEKQKIAIASMLALNPDVLILDEPTSNLDPEATWQIFNMLYQMIEDQDLTVIIIEHKLSQLKHLNPKLIALESGQRLPIMDIPSFEAYIEDNITPLPTLERTNFAVPNPILVCEDLSVSLGKVNVLKSINLKIQTGEFVALSGPNGSGKTTLLNTLMGFYKPESGRCFGLGHDLSNTPTSQLVKHIGMVFQNPDHQIFTQSVWDEALLAATHLNMLDEEMISRALTWLTKMSLDNRKNDHPQRLSYGEKRRLNILSILLHQPTLLLMDEFLIGQDLANALAWMSFFRSYCDQGNTVLFVTHHAGLAQQFCDRMIYLSEGSVIVDAPVGKAFETIKLFDMPGNLQVVEGHYNQA